MKHLRAEASDRYQAHADDLGEALGLPRVKAHYDGERILLDEPFEIPPNSPLMVTILPATEAVMGDDWIMAARKALSAAYGADEPEYGTDDLRRR